MHTELFNQLQQAQSILVVTGAGISVASGIAPFRGSNPDAVWNRDVMEKGTIAYFFAQPVDSWSWYYERFDGIVDKDPNPAHHALTIMEKWALKQGKTFQLITQNIDGLHRKANCENLIEIHGSAQFLRCSEDGCRNGAPHGFLQREEVDFAPFLAEKKKKNLPRCILCGNLIRPHVLWFDEYYTGHSAYRYADALRYAKQTNLVLFVGTSFAVGITESIYRSSIFEKIPMWSLDPHAMPEYPGIRWLEEYAEKYLPMLMKELRAE